MPRTHIHSETFPVSPKDLFQLLHTPSAIREWWSANRAVTIPKAGGAWMAAWGDDEDEPDYVSSAVLDVFEPPHRLRMVDQRYFSRHGPLPFEAAFVTEFVVEPDEDGARLTVRQEGFPDEAIADDFYAACDTGWRNTFAGIRRYLSSRG